MAGIAFLALATAKGGAQTGAGDANPIDLSITVQPGHSSKKVSKQADAKKTTSAAPTGNFHKHNLPAWDTESGSLRNAVGIPSNLNAGSKSTGTGRDPVAAIDVTAKNAVGAKNSANAGGRDLSHPGPSAGPANSGPIISHPSLGAVLSAVVAMHTAKVTGTNVVRPGSGPGAVGGGNKNIAGVINGTGIRPKP